MRAQVVDTLVAVRSPSGRDGRRRHVPSSLARAERSCFEDGPPLFGIDLVAVVPSCGRDMVQPQDPGPREPHRP
jgi:hypothetical protein